MLDLLPALSSEVRLFICAFSQSEVYFMFLNVFKCVLLLYLYRFGGFILFYYPIFMLISYPSSFFYHFSILLAYVHLLHYVFSLIYFPLVLFLLYCDIFIIFMSVFFK